MHQNRLLAAIMFTDIVGYTSLMEHDESEALYILEINRQIIQTALKQYNGHCTKEIGDGTLSTFHSTVDALACASKILTLIAQYPKLNLRIALHLGDIIQEGNDIFGDGVNITARLEPLAPCNGIAISQHFHAQIQGKTSYQFKSIGFPTLKNISSKIEVFTWHPSYSSNGADKALSSVSRLSFSLTWLNYKTAFFVFLLALGGYFGWQQKWLSLNTTTITVNTPSNVPESSIAVLKFANIGASLQNQYFNDGLSEELLNLLARIKELKVASRTSTWALPKNVTSAMVREQLNVNYMVEGSIRKSNDKVRITVQLIETKTGFHLWSQTYDRKLDDTLVIQDEIALKITTSLKLLLSAQSLQALANNKQVNALAYEHYLKAKQFLRQPKTKTSLLAAIESFNSAIAIENTFELARAGKCKGLIEFYQLSLSNDDFQSAEKNCLAILKSNSYQSEIYNSLGELYLVSGQFEEAESNFQAALTLDLSSVDALIGIARAQTKLTNYTIAEQYFIRAVQTAPNYGETHEHYGSYLFYQGRYTQAINEFKKVILLNPYYGDAYNSLGAAYFANGDVNRGVQSFQKSIEINENHEAYSNLGTAFFIKKNFVQAANMYQQAIDLSPDDYRYWGFLAESFEHIANKKFQMNDAYAQAIKRAEKMLVINDKSNELLVSLALYYAKINHHYQARNLLNKLKNKDLLADSLYTMSVSYLALNDKVQALNYLSKAINKGYDKELAFADESFMELSKHKRFKELTQ
ncbi:MAG: hypothetical protein COB83_06130 [Gammaproteobacteria bacterium]|nr:MAG: hypothetical protein COB83_06130 [Gammaproteobacteria bacterium]